MFARCSYQLFNVRHVYSMRVLYKPRQLLDTHTKGCYNICQICPIVPRHLQRPRTYPAYWINVRNIWRDLFGKYLLATNIISSGVLMVVGDLIAQEIEYQRHPPESECDRYNWMRVWQMFIVGALQGPLHHFVYQWMDRIMPKPTLGNVIKKILIDQFLMSPLCILIFFYSACFLEKKTLKETNCELIEKFPIIYITDWLVWPSVQFMNFRYLDTKYRVLFVNVCTALYNIFLSFMKHDCNMKMSER